MSNTYLEKIALNIFKARQMAKKVGVIADSSTPWKYALRKLRDSRGEPLQGKALQEGRIALGDISHNAYNQVVGKSRKLAYGTEISERINPAKDIMAPNKIDPEGSVIGKIRDGSVSSKVGNNLHTHPHMNRLLYRIKNWDGEMNIGYREQGGPHRLASPSGFDEYSKKPDLTMHERKKLNNDYIDRARHNESLSSPENKEFLESQKRKIAISQGRLGKLKKFMKGTSDEYYQEKKHKMFSLVNRLESRVEPIEKVIRDSSPKAIKQPTFESVREVDRIADMKSFSTDTKEPIQRIVAPSAQSVAVVKQPSKGSLKKPTITYWDHSPRKSRT